MGMVEVSGLAAGPYTMVAPITTMPCYYYRTYVWEWKREGKNSKWVKVAAECMYVPFFLDDNTGRVLVDPRGADLDIHRDFQEEFCDSFFTTKDPAPLNVRNFLARHGVETGNKIKVEEYCIKPKNSLFVLGTLAENPGLEVTANPIVDTEGVRSSLVSSPGFTFSFSSIMGAAGIFNAGSFVQRLAAISNGPGLQTIPAATSKPIDPAQRQQITAALLKAGISNPAAWAAAGLGNTALQVIEDPLVAAGKIAFDCHPAVALMQGTNNSTFLISWRSQRDVARSIGWKSTLMIWGGPVLALLSLYLLLNITKLF
jgi:hypothetical protein